MSELNLKIHLIRNWIKTSNHSIKNRLKVSMWGSHNKQPDNPLLGQLCRPSWQIPLQGTSSSDVVIPSSHSFLFNCQNPPRLHSQHSSLNMRLFKRIHVFVTWFFYTRTFPSSPIPKDVSPILALVTWAVSILSSTGNSPRPLLVPTLC